ncbi:hypothetical protein BDQ17DRAFT_1345741 [Cyathus striatus]|nr:hypothetical protein BDQ17DRAFT_1345741 [Cyathus striatus]
MAPEGQRMTVNSEHGIGYSYYTACVGDPTSMQFVYEESSPFINVGESIVKTFVVMGVNERPLRKLRDFYVPQAVWKLYRNAKQLRKTTVRGALSDGYEWIFLILSFNEDGSASYMQSGIIPAVYTPQTPCPDLDVIAGIISHWTQKCYCNLDDEDDWFSFKTASGVDIRTINAMY